MMGMRIYLFFGPPGSGKGTQANLLKQKFTTIFYLSTGDCIRYHIKNQTEIGKMAYDYISKGQLVPSSVINQLVLEEINKIRDDKSFDKVILDGYPRTIEQLEFLIQNVSEPYITLFFDLPLDKIVERICLRRICPNCNAIYHLMYNRPLDDELCNKCGFRLIQREDDREEIVKTRYEVYKTETLPVIKVIEERGIRLVFVDSSRTIDQVFEQVVPYFMS